MERFAGRVALVTGGGSGIGRATVHRLVDEGATVVAADLSADGLELTARARPGPMRSRRSSATSATRRSARARWPPRSSTAGSTPSSTSPASCGSSTATRSPSTAGDRILAVNLTGTFLACQAALPALLDGGGAIVNVASTAALAGHPWAAAYSASKGGVLALTSTLAIEYAKQGLRVNAVCPGSIDTPITGDFELPEGVDGRLIHRIMSPVGMADPNCGGGRHRLPRLATTPPTSTATTSGSTAAPTRERRAARVLLLWHLLRARGSRPPGQDRRRARVEHLTVSDHLINPVATRSTYPYTQDGSRRWEMCTPWPDPWVTIGAWPPSPSGCASSPTSTCSPAHAGSRGQAGRHGRRAVREPGRPRHRHGLDGGGVRRHGQPFGRRGKRADEMLEVLRKLWTGGWVEHHGEHFDFRRRDEPAPTAPVPVLRRGACRRPRSDGRPATTAGSATSTPPRSWPASGGASRRYREEYGRTDVPFAVFGSCSDACDLDGYRRLARRRRHPPADAAVVLLRRSRRRPAGQARRHPALRRRRHRQVVTPARR